MDGIDGNFVNYVEQRHSIWEQRQLGDGSWKVGDPILQERKFTNVYRVLDYGSQFFIRDLATPHSGPRDTLFRSFLYRHTGRWEMWEFFNAMEGRPPIVEDGELVFEVFNAYRDSDPRLKGGKAVFTGAYLVFPQSHTKGTDKLRSIVDLALRLFTPGSPDDIWPDFDAATTQADRYQTLRRNKGVGDFMAMQVLTDWGYTHHAGEDREGEFVVPGPGARRGTANLHPKEDPVAVINRYALYFELLGTVALSLPTGGFRTPSLMDVQNCMCEWSKYVRFRDRTPAGRPYQPAHPGQQPRPTLPQHWKDD